MRLIILSLLLSIASLAIAQSKGENNTKADGTATQGQSQLGVTEKSPLVVKVLPTPKCKDDADAKKGECREEPEAEWWMVKLTVVLAFLALFQLIWIIRQEHWQRRHERAYAVVGPGGPREPLDDGKIAVRLSFENFGRTPAFLEEVEWDARPERDLPRLPVYRNKISNTLGASPNRRENTEAFYDFNPDWQETHVLYVRATYRDVFNKKHVTADIWRISGDDDGVSHSPLGDKPEYSHRN